MCFHIAVLTQYYIITAFACQVKKYIFLNIFGIFLFFEKVIDFLGFFLYNENKYEEKSEEL